MPFDLKKLNFGGIPKIDPAETILDHLESTERVEYPPDVKSTTGNIVLCQECKEKERKSSQSFLCVECDEHRRGVIPIAPMTPVSELIASRDLSSEGIHELRQLDFAPVSVRYSGKQLDEIAWAMLPSVPEELMLDIRKLAEQTIRKMLINDADESNTQKLTIQDLDAMAEYHYHYSNFLKQLSIKQKDKIILKAKPELQAREKERRANEKEKKIQNSIPRDITSKHTANIVLSGIAEITAPLDKSLSALMKKFLDHVSLQSQVEDKIDTNWLTLQLSKKAYLPLKPYFKMKAS